MHLQRKMRGFHNFQRTALFLSVMLLRATPALCADPSSCKDVNSAPNTPSGPVVYNPWYPTNIIPYYLPTPYGFPYAIPFQLAVPPPLPVPPAGKPVLPPDQPYEPAYTVDNSFSAQAPSNTCACR